MTSSAYNIIDMIEQSSNTLTLLAKTKLFLFIASHYAYFGIPPSTSLAVGPSISDLITFCITVPLATTIAMRELGPEGGVLAANSSTS